MNRERALKLVLVVLGVLFSAGIYPLTMILWERDRSQSGDAMLLSLYVTLGILLLIAVRNPSENRSLIAFTTWSSFAHAAVMVVQAFQNAKDREFLIASATLVVIGVTLIALSPPKQTQVRASAVTS